MKSRPAESEGVPVEGGAATLRSDTGDGVMATDFTCFCLD